MKSKVIDLKLIALGLMVLIGVAFKVSPLKAADTTYGCQQRKNNICMILIYKGTQTVYYGVMGKIEIK